VKIAVVHDYFIQQGGAEKLAEAIYHMFPQADLFATVALQKRMPESLRHVSVKTTWMQRLPLLATFYRFYFPLYPLAVGSLDLSRYDLVISSSSGYAKGVRANVDAIHVCYCHTPMRWVWSFKSYSARESFGGAVKHVLRAMIRGLRAWDEGAARQPDHFIANSSAVAARIARAYGRYAEVIHPPIDIDRFPISHEHGAHYIVLARLVAYKRIDLAVEAMTRLKKKLVVIGDGPAMASLKANAGPTIRFVGRASDQEVEEYVRSCRALIFPGDEDFGMAPLEVAAAGRPTIAFKSGGAVETVIDGQTGVFFDEQTPDDLMDAIIRFERMEWNRTTIRRHAENFSVAIFERNMRQFLRRVGVPMEDSCCITSD
jgi:glycosyltransferase involved in cell wall biosynthesis